MVGTTHCTLVLHQALIISAQTGKEQYTRHILEAVYPLPSLALLTTDIDHEHVVVAQGEDSFGDANCPGTSMDDVLLVRHICRIK